MNYMLDQDHNRLVQEYTYMILFLTLVMMPGKGHIFI